MEGVAKDADMKPLGGSYPLGASVSWLDFIRSNGNSLYILQERRPALCRLTLFYTN